MKKNLINPWKWQDNLGFCQAVEVQHAQSTLYCAGACPVDENGQAVDADMAAQVQLALDNLEIVLGQSGYRLADVVRLNYYTTSIPEFFEGYHQVVARLQSAGCTPSSTLLEISALAQPGLKIEIEATAVK